MEVAWSGFRSVYPYSASRYEGVCGDEEVEKLKQPLIGRDEYDPADDDDDNYSYDNALEDEEAGLLLHSYGDNHGHCRDQIKYANAKSTYKQQQSAYGGGFMASVEPKFLRSISKITELAASAFKASPLSSFAAAPKAKEKDDNYGSRNSAGMISSIRSVVRTRRKTETTEDITEKALARIAMLTIACTVLLLLGVSAHAS